MAGLPGANVELVYQVTVTCPPGVPATAWQVTALPGAAVFLWTAEFKIPYGHNGATGIALMDSGAFIIPFNPSGPSWLKGNGDLLTYPYQAQLGTTVALATYNTGCFSHSWEVRLTYTPMSAFTTTGASITVPDLSGWLPAAEAQVAATG